MKSYGKLSNRYLVQQKKRTFLTILAVMFSVTLLCSLFTLMYSYYDTKVKETIVKNGDFEVQFSNLTEMNYYILKNNINFNYKGTSVRFATSKIFTAPATLTPNTNTTSTNNAAVGNNSSSNTATTATTPNANVNSNASTNTSSNTSANNNNNNNSSTTPIVDEEVSNNKYLRITAFDQLAINKTLTIKLAEGRLPKNSKEIVIEKDALSYLGNNLKLGDEINIKTNPKYNAGNDNVVNEKAFEGVAEDSYLPYTLVGIAPELDDPSSARIFKAYTLCNTSDIISNTNIKSIFLDVNSPSKKLDIINYAGLTVGIVQDDGKTLVPNVEINRNLLPTINLNSTLLSLRLNARDAGFNTMMRLIIGFIILIICLCSIAVIYNAFNMSLMERISKLGTLRCIGATRSQMMYLVLKEALFISLLGIPLGILGGIGIVKLMVLLLGGNLSSLSQIPFIVSVNYLVILASSIIGLLTVLASAIVPAIKASMISPITATRNPGLTNNVNKKIRGGILVKWLFKVEGDLAYRNIKRSKKKFIITIASLTLSVFMFISFSALLDYQKLLSNKNTLGYDAEIGIINSKGKDISPAVTMSALNKIKAIAGVQNTYVANNDKFLQEIKKENLNPLMYNGVEIYETSNNSFFFNGQIYSFNTDTIANLKPLLVAGDPKTMDLENNGVIIVNSSYVDVSADEKGNLLDRPAPKPAAASNTAGTPAASGNAASSPATPNSTTGTPAASGNAAGSPATPNSTTGAPAASGNAASSPATPNSTTGTPAASGNAAGSPATPNSTTGTPAASGNAAGSPATPNSTTGAPAASGNAAGNPATPNSTTGTPAASGTTTSGNGTTNANSGTATQLTPDLTPRFSKKVYGNFSNYKLGDTIKVPILSTAEAQGLTYGPEPKLNTIKYIDLKVVGIMDTDPLTGEHPYNSMELIMSQSNLQKIASKQGSIRVDRLIINSSTSTDRNSLKALVQELNQTYKNAGYKFTLNDYRAYNDAVAKDKLEKDIFVYGFIFMILLISAVNIFNSINSNLMLKKREYATLKAIGATQFQIQKLVLLEGMLHGLIAALVGSVFATIASYAFYKIVCTNIVLAFVPPYQYISMGMAGCLVITLLATLSPLRRIKKDNIIESIRVEE